MIPISENMRSGMIVTIHDICRDMKLVAKRRLWAETVENVSSILECIDDVERRNSLALRVFDVVHEVIYRVIVG